MPPTKRPARLEITLRSESNPSPTHVYASSEGSDEYVHCTGSSKLSLFCNAIITENRFAGQRPRSLNEEAPTKLTRSKFTRK